MLWAVSLLWTGSTVHAEALPRECRHLEGACWGLSPRATAAARACPFSALPVQPSAFSLLLCLQGSVQASPARSELSRINAGAGRTMGISHRRDLSQVFYLMPFFKDIHT